jgi:ribosome recycling factor
MEDDNYVDAVLEDCRDKMAKALEHTRAEFATIRTGRAAPALVEKLRVEYYGSEVPLQQLAGIQVPEAKIMVITPYDKSSLKAIERAIQNSDLGVNPNNDGVVIRLTFPPLTQERRKAMVKVAHGKAEEGRVAVRNLRRAARKDLEAFEKDGEISSDELDRAEKELERVTHDFVADIDRVLHHKEGELLAV